jgi:hypothetical protein
MQTVLIASLLFDASDIGTTAFFPLLQEGFMVKAQVGCSMADMLREQFGLSSTYIEDRIRTAFLDGQPVDDFETVIISDGSTLALSAAMPGLVGATFRKGGMLASFRGTITHQSSNIGTELRQGIVSIKLFNFLAKEIGDAFLKRGIFINMQAAESFFSHQPDRFWAACKAARMYGQDLRVEQLPGINWSEREGFVYIRLDL